MWPCLLLVCCGAAPIFGEDSANPWDALRDVFYVRRFTTGEVYEHPVALDRPPWENWARFYRDEGFHDHVVKTLTAFLAQSKGEVERQPALRRAILLRDLWPAFDAQTHAHERDPPPSAVERQARLRQLLARVMRRLELTDDEARHLTDNYRRSSESHQFASEFDPQSPTTAFLPVDLLDDEGPWVAFGRGAKGLGGQAHAEASGYRSVFAVYIRVNDRRESALEFLAQKRKNDNLPPPQGSRLALLRRMALPTTSGRVVPTPVVESLQLFVVDTPRDHRHKIVLDRRALLSGDPGLRAVARDEPTDVFAFEAGGLRLHGGLKYDADGEELILGRYHGNQRFEPSLEHCSACHGITVGSRLFANSAGILPTPTSWAAQAEKILTTKTTREEWAAYQAARLAGD
jgi:hypothetical protein